MKTTLQIFGKDYNEYMKVKSNGRVQYFEDSVVLEYENSEKLELEIETVDFDEYLKNKFKNPFLRFAVKCLNVVMSVLTAFLSADEGQGLDKIYYSLQPFVVKKRFLITDPEGKTLKLKYIKPKYDKVAKRYYTTPDFVTDDEYVLALSYSASFCESKLGHDVGMNYAPIYVLAFAVLVFLNILCADVIADTVNNIPDFYVAENSLAVFCVSVLGVVVLLLLAAFIIMAIRLRRLYKKVCSETLTLLETHK